MSQDAITKLARGQECQIRLVGICSGDPETTVPCHFRLGTLSGMGVKPNSLFIAWGCSQCHSWVDSHKDADTQLAFAHGVLRTQAILIQRGVVKLGKAA